MATNILSRTRTKYVTVKQYTEILNLTRPHAYRLVRDPNFPKLKVGEKAIRIPLEEALTYIEKKYNQ